MSEPTSTPAAAPSAPAATPPAPAPAVDEGKIAKQAAEAAAKDATKAAKDAAKSEVASAMRDVFKKLSGEEEEPKHDPLHVEFAKDPAAFVQGIVAVTEQRIEENLTKKQSRERGIAKAIDEVAQQFPDITQNLDIADVEFQKVKKEKGDDVPEDQILKEALTRTAKRLGLKSQTDAERNFYAARAGLPPAGNSSSPGEKRPPAPQSDEAYAAHIKARRDLHRANTTRQKAR